ncbi:hypothetical protein HZS_2059 [Henneguya salminicola]|nr:hypothetical protein HZS_2059 [Henneguya salminicola]
MRHQKTERSVYKDDNFMLKNTKRQEPLLIRMSLHQWMEACNIISDDILKRRIQSSSYFAVSLALIRLNYEENVCFQVQNNMV